LDGCSFVQGGSLPKQWPSKSASRLGGKLNGNEEGLGEEIVFARFVDDPEE